MLATECRSTRIRQRTREPRPVHLSYIARIGTVMEATMTITHSCHPRQCRTRVRKARSRHLIRVLRMSRTRLFRTAGKPHTGNVNANGQIDRLRLLPSPLRLPVS